MFLIWRMATTAIIDHVHMDAHHHNTTILSTYHIKICHGLSLIGFDEAFAECMYIYIYTYNYTYDMRVCNYTDVDTHWRTVGQVM